MTVDLFQLSCTNRKSKPKPMHRINKLTSEFIKCKHCGNFAPLDIVAHYYRSIKPEPYYPEDEYYDSQPDYGYNYDLLLCLACEKVTLREYFEHDCMDGEDIKVEILYPLQGINLYDLPSLVQKAYEAALKARGINANAYAMLLGSLLEVVCEDREIKGDDLYDKLKVLAEKGEIPEKLVGVAHGLRKLRNIGVHESFEGLSTDEIPILDDLSKAILEYIYVAPSLAIRAEERLKRLKKQKLEDAQKQVE
jgi:Domain of unknown function (DUF4145)